MSTQQHFSHPNHREHYGLFSRGLSKPCLLFVQFAPSVRNCVFGFVGGARHFTARESSVHPLAACSDSRRARRAPEGSNAIDL